MSLRLRPLPAYLVLIPLPIVIFGLFGPGSPTRYVLSSVWAAFMTLTLVVVIHEVGHLLGGMAVGMKPSLLVAGPIVLRGGRHGVEVSVNEHWKPLGLAIATPGPTDRLRWRIGWMVAGGPVANLASGALVGTGFAAALLAWSPTKPEIRALLDRPIGLVAFCLLVNFLIVSVIVGLSNLLPLRSGGFVTDGGRLLMLIRGGAAATRWTDLWLLQASYTAGQPPEEWDAEALERALLPADGSVDELGAASMAHYRALALGEMERAGELLDRTAEVSEKIPALRPAVAPSAAFFEALVRRDPNTARTWLAECRGPFVSEVERLLAEAAILTAEGEPEAAREMVRRTRAASLHLPPHQRGSAFVAERCLGMIENELDAGAPALAT